MEQVNENRVKRVETMTTEEGEEGSTKKESTKKEDNILHSVSIGNEEKGSLSFERFIQFIGGGHFNKLNKQNENNTSENSTESDDSTSIVHLLDATTEDPFTLESFDTLIQQHAEKDKDFIIAKVTTVDPLDETKYYHSFYSGHHINKILFRTQPDQGLLHRMKAKNPLNNMNIIGDVYYYIVKAASVKKSPTFAKSSSMSITSRKTLTVKEGNGATIVATSSLNKTEERDFTINIEDIEDVISRANRLHSAPPSLWNFDCSNTKNDEEEAIEMSLRLSENIKNKRWSAGDSIKPPPKVFTSENSSTSGDVGRNLEKLLSTIKSQTFNNNNNNDDDGKGNDNGNDNDNNNNDNSQLVKEYSVSIPNDDNKSASSLEEQNISSPTIMESPTKEVFSIPFNEMEEGKQSIYYKATFYATDDDFLMRSTVRQFFKSNALDSLDVQLFTINTSPHNNSHATTTLNTPSMRLERMVTNNGTEFTDSTPSHSRRNSQSRNSTSDAAASRWWRSIHNLRMNKGLKWLVLMYMVFGFLLIRFVVNETYAYLMAFLLMLCLFLVFCVGSGVGIWGR